MLEELYLKNSLLPKRYLKDIPLSPASVDEKTFEELNNIKLNIGDFVSEGNNLLIYSSRVGNGKSTWATKMLKAYIKSVSDIKVRNNCPALFINVNNFLNEKKLAINDKELALKINEIEKNILKAKLVVFDDIGVKDISQYDIGQLYYWIDYRTSNMLSSIYTSNLMPSQLKTALDDRIYSRVVNYSVVKEILDGDNREVVKC